MRDFVCGFTEAEVGFLQSNAVCEPSTLATTCHHRYVDSGRVEDLDAFMDALAAWREASSYPFPPYYTRTVH